MMGGKKNNFGYIIDQFLSTNIIEELNISDMQERMKS